MVRLALALGAVAMTAHAAPAGTITLGEFNCAFTSAAYCKVTAADASASDGLAVGGEAGPAAGTALGEAHYSQLGQVACAAAGGEWVQKPGFQTDAQLSAAISAQQGRNALRAGADTKSALYVAKAAGSALYVNRARRVIWASSLGMLGGGTAAVDAAFGSISVAADTCVGASPGCDLPGGCAYFQLYLTPAQAALFGTHASLVRDFAALFPVPDALKMSPELAVGGANGARSGTFSIALSPGALGTMDDTKALANAWQSALSSVGGCDAAAGACQFTAESTDTISVKGIPDAAAAGGGGESAIEAGARIVMAQEQAMFMEPAVKYTTSNKYAQWVVQAGGGGEEATEATPQPTVRRQPLLWARGLHGEGEMVGVADSGLDHESCFFRDDTVPITPALNRVNNSPNHRKVKQYAAFADATEGEDNGHGTHVCGSIVGHDHKNEGQAEFNGVAYEAKLAFFDIGRAGVGSLSVPRSLATSMFPTAYALGARVHSNSWGASANVYSTNARDVDSYSFANQDFLVLVAAGNDGARGPGSIGTPATAKNCLTVGASASVDESFTQGRRRCPYGAGNCERNVAPFSSIGPGPDGRRLPDVVAPGYFTFSAKSKAVGARHCELYRTAGTSMATPITAGVALLVRQYFREGWYPTGRKESLAAPRPGLAKPFAPMGALVKAVLINSARLLSGAFGNTPLDAAAGPSDVQGFGLVTVADTLAFSGNTTHDLFVAGDFGSMGASSISTAGPTGSRSFRFIIAKRDPPQLDGANPGGAGAARELPLRATLVWHDPAAAVNSREQLVNDLDLSIAPALPDGVTADAARSLPAAANRDKLNNVEQVVIASPKAGDVYVVTVSATKVPQGPQPFSLVVRGSFLRGRTTFGANAPTVQRASYVPMLRSALTAGGGRLLITGTGFATDASLNSVTVSCASSGQAAVGAAPPVATVAAAAADGGSIAVNVQNGGSCGLGVGLVVSALVSDSMEIDEPAQVTAVAAPPAGGGDASTDGGGGGADSRQDAIRIQLESDACNGASSESVCGWIGGGDGGFCGWVNGNGDDPKTSLGGGKCVHTTTLPSSGGGASAGVVVLALLGVASAGFVARKVNERRGSGASWGGAGQGQVANYKYGGQLGHATGIESAAPRSAFGAAAHAYGGQAAALQAPTAPGRNPAAVPVQLPHGWATATDAEGDVYYYNKETKETSWEHPGHKAAELAQKLQASRAAVPPPLPPRKPVHLRPVVPPRPAAGQAAAAGHEAAVPDTSPLAKPQSRQSLLQQQPVAGPPAAAPPAVPTRPNVVRGESVKDRVKRMSLARDTV